MSDRRPLASVILPSFNRLHHLKVAVTSVLEQTHADWELVIADDGSEKETTEYLRGLSDPRIRTLWLPHSGNPSHVRNMAIQSARGLYLAFLDSDDRWDTRKLEIQLSALQADPGRRWSYTAVERIDEAGRPMSDEGIAPWTAHGGDIVEEVLRVEAHIATPSVVAERNLVEEVGGFDEEQWFAEDYDLWLRLAVRSEVTVLSDRLTFVRDRGDSYSRNRIGAYEGWVRLYRKAAKALPDPRLSAIARRKGSESALRLAYLQADARNCLATWRTLIVAAPRSWTYPRWSREAAKTMIRAALPESVMSVFGRSRRRCCPITKRDPARPNGS